MKKDDIDDLFKKSFENYEAEVNPSVWKNIRIGLKWGGLALLFNTLLHKIGFGTIIAILSSAVIISTVAILNKKNKSDDVTQNTKIETQLPPPIIEKPASVLDTTQEQKLENGKPLSEGNSNNTQKTAAATNTIVESSKKDNKKIESVINKFSKEPIASISASPVGGTAPLIVDLSNTGSGKTNKWTYSDGKKDKSTSNPVHVFETPGIYSVILTSTNDKGETATDSIKVEVTGNSSISSIPKDFSPNGDGVLDVFVFQTKNIAKMNA
ncbi:MAG: PKD domain-containing protein, partial [Bacteroidota bacterium]